MTHFMRYVNACMVEDLQELTYRFYVTDSLKAVSGAKVRYADIIGFTKNMPKEERSSEEVIGTIKEKLGAMILQDKGGDE